jgi:hypothetical protein
MQNNQNQNWMAHCVLFAVANLRPELECEYALRPIPLSRLGHPETAFAQHGNHS